jgi:hypothetical protein
MDQDVTKTVSHVVPVSIALWIERMAAKLGVSKSKFVTDVLTAARAASEEKEAA